MPGGRVEGTVTSVTEAGNLVTDIGVDQLRNAPRNDHTVILCDEHETRGLFSHEHSQPPFTFLALLADAGTLELTIVGDNARDMLGIRPGAKVTVQW
jgi:S-adenosylmethionine hydrolase